MDTTQPTQAYEAFKSWFEDNQTLAEDLQSWLFYTYAVAEGKTGDVESRIEVADVVVYICLFYLSSKNGFSYDLDTTTTALADTLDTTADVVLTALDSLQAHDVLSFEENGDALDIHIFPIEVNAPHSCCGHHDHDDGCCGHHDYDEEHSCCGHHDHGEEHDCCGHHDHDDGEHDHHDGCCGSASCGCGQH